MGQFKVEALKGVDFTITGGEFLAVVGPSGSGKSSFLHIIGFMDAPTSGEVIFEDKSLSEMKDKERTEKRLRKIGFVFQTFNLLPNLNALENVEIVLRLAGLSKAKRRPKARNLL